MATMRNEFGEPRVCPSLGFHEVADGETITVPDEEIEHWVAGGWVPADPASVKAAKAAADARAAAFAALTAPAPSADQTPAVAPAEPTKDSAAPAPEGKQP